MRQILALLLASCVAISVAAQVAQSQENSESSKQQTTNRLAQGATAPAGISLTRRQAEALALKKNPQITVAKLRAMVAGQYVREQRSALLPTAYLSLTGVDASTGARISAGGLNNPIIYPRAATAATVIQLISDIVRSTN